MLQKVRNFGVWQGLSCFFGQILPVVLAVILSVALVFYLFFEAKEDSIIKRIASNDVRNLGLLLAASIGWFFLYWRAKTAEQNTETAKKVLTAEQITRAVEQLAHEKPSVRLGGILGLEQVALTQEEERTKIARILVSFILPRARKKSEESKKDLAACNLSKLKGMDDFSAYRERRLGSDFIKIGHPQKPPKRAPARNNFICYQGFMRRVLF